MSITRNVSFKILFETYISLKNEGRYGVATKSTFENIDINIRDSCQAAPDFSYPSVPNEIFYSAFYFLLFVIVWQVRARPSYVATVVGGGEVLQTITVAGCVAEKGNAYNRVFDCFQKPI